MSLTSRCDMFVFQPKKQLSLKLFTHHRAIMSKRHVSTGYHASLNEAKYTGLFMSVKHFKNSQQIDYTTDHGNSYVDRERNCCSF